MEAPSQTIYINNINEKIKKGQLKRLLYMVFSQYGKIIEIVACKGLKLRGQAWVVFDDVGSATKALRGKQGFNFYDKPLKIAFAKTKSDILLRREGNSAIKSKRSRDEESDEHSKESRSANKILFAQNLPPGFNEDALRSLFQHCPGLVDVRVPPGEQNAGKGFLEFSDETQAGLALRQLNGFALSASHALSLSLAN